MTPKKSQNVIQNHGEDKAPKVFWHFRKRRDRATISPLKKTENISPQEDKEMDVVSKSVDCIANPPEDNAPVVSKNTKQHRKISTRPHAVRFAEENLVHCFEPADLKDSNLLWYTRQELAAMNEYNKSVVAAKLSSQSSDPDSWFRTVLQVYRAFRSNCSKSEVLAILSTCNIYFDENTIGMVNAAIPVIARDFQVRREHLIARVKYYQSNSKLDKRTRAKLISDTSHLASHVSRSLAVFMAHLIVGDE
eukprot:scaffold46464_cov199-Amphora_coffeaeformis.AAC.6